MKYFYKELKLDIPESVYCPREDSELLAGILEGMDLRGKKTLEIGCGSGFLSIIMAKNGASVTSVDTNPEAASITKINAGKNKVEINAIESDLFENVKDIFDMVIFNPPYLPTEPGENDITYSGGSSGRETIERFIIGSKNHIIKDGIVLVLISSLTDEKEVIKIFESAGMNAKPICRKKIPWEELVVIEAKLK
jgi:release factor glutamine methyltransferase